MSRRRRRRDVLTPSPIANPRLPRVTAPSLSLPVLRPSSLLTEIEDRRTYSPLGPLRGAVSFSGAQHGLRAVDRKTTDRFSGLRKFPSQTKAHVGFDAPVHVLVCVRRKRRKEVLFAKRKTGSGGGRQRRPRHNWFSKIHC